MIYYGNSYWLQPLKRLISSIRLFKLQQGMNITVLFDFFYVSSFVWSEIICHVYIFYPTSSVPYTLLIGEYCNGTSLVGGNRHNSSLAMLVQLIYFNSKHVSFVEDVPRVNGQLAFARALGDMSCYSYTRISFCTV